MPPIRTRSSRNLVEQEGRILLAIQAIKKQEISSIREASRHFEVHFSSLRNRLNGLTNRSETRPSCSKLTEIVEESLQKWILSMDSRGAPPRPSSVREMADTRRAWIYPGYFGQRELGNSLIESINLIIISIELTTM
jgi:hypothetical protein